MGLERGRFGAVDGERTVKKREETTRSKAALVLGSSLVLALGLGACTATNPTRANDARLGNAPSPPCPRSATSGANDPLATPPPTYALRLSPKPGEAPEVAVEVVWTGGTVSAFTSSAEPREMRDVRAHDAKGPIAVRVSAASTGTRLDLGRASEGRLVLEFRHEASADPSAPTRATVVADDRFRAFGESLVPLPVGAEDAAQDVTVTVELEALRAPLVASSLGIGSPQAKKLTPRALSHVAFVAGSMGKAVFDEGSGERDEITWLGYTSFDPRPAAAELAQIRTALRETLKGGGEPWFAVEFVSSSRPEGRFAVVPRYHGALVHLGPSEPWSSKLRLELTRRMLRPWFGGELTMAEEKGHEVRAAWFVEGVARVVGARVLAKLGLLAPNDAQAFVNDLVTRAAFSPYRGKSRAEVAEKATTDPDALEALELSGALHALHLHGSVSRHALKSPAPGAGGLDALVRALLERARASNQALPETAWIEALGSVLDNRDEATKRFRADVDERRDLELAEGTLGRCFRTERVRVNLPELGFDLAATLDDRARALGKVKAGSALALAGGRPTDVLVDVRTDKTGRATLSVLRDGKKIDLVYDARGRAETVRHFVRVAGIRDADCGELFPD